MAIVQFTLPFFVPQMSLRPPQLAPGLVPLAQPAPTDWLKQLLVALQQLQTGWSGYVAPRPAFQPAPSGSGQQYGLAAGLGGLQGVSSSVPVVSPGGYAGGSGPLPPTATDSQEYASYLQAQLAGGSLQGKTGIAQRDAIVGSRFGRIPDPTQWNAAVARDYTYQFAAYATGADALTPAGMQAGADALNTMSPDARLFTQVASVFKGDLLGGPGFYNNPGLRQLLLSHGLADLANKPGVGETDVQTVGAVTAAMNRGAITLDDVINSGTIDNMPRYQQVINYVQSGAFAQDVHHYETA